MLKTIKNMIMSLLPERIILLFKTGIELGKYNCVIRKIEKEVCLDTAFLLGTPMHDNLGDHAITYAEKLFLLDLGYKNIVEIPIEVFKLYQKRLVNAIPDNADIFINGGGWMGNLWPCDEILMQAIVSSFSKHKLLIFPQTIYYNKENLHYEELIKSGEYFYNHCERLTMCVREKNSYIFAITHYQNVKVLLQPDIACYLKKKVHINKSKKSGRKILGICIRNDRENTNLNYTEKVKEQLVGDNYKIRYVSTLVRYRVPTFLREKAILAKFKEFLQCDLIITNRLHGMIFAYILNIPCIAFDNLSKKVSGVYNEWLKDKANIIFIETTADICDIRKKLTCIVKDTTDCSDIDFTVLREEIINGKN